MVSSATRNDWQLTVYIPKSVREENLLGRLERLASQRRRSVNFLVVEAIRRYLQQENSAPS